MTASSSSYFAVDYRDARARFLDACVGSELSPEPVRHPAAAGPSGEALYVDVVRLGPQDAERILFVTSGTHGVEGLCGSGLQVGLLREGALRALPAGVAAVLVHAANPHGFAHLRRVNEDNVDLNRNFIDFDAPLPENHAYDEVHAMLVPADWDGPARAAADARIAAYKREHGAFAFQAAVTGGQYRHADGLFYGGRQPAWSNRTWRSIVRRHGAGCRRAVLVDFHTGLGPYGYGEPIFLGDSDGYDRALRWFGDDVTWPEKGTSTSAMVSGVLGYGLSQELPQAQTTLIGLEFGTLDVDTVLDALRADNWLHLHGDPASEAGRAVKAQMRAAFYCDDDGWKRSVWERGVEIVGRALAGLAQDV